MIDSIIIFEDEGYTNLFPLVYLRPTYELLCGILTLREKIEYHFNESSITLHARNYLEGLLNEENPNVLINELIPDSKTVLFINGRVILDNTLVDFIKTSDENTLLVCGGEIVAAKVSGDSLNIFKKELPELFNLTSFQNLSVINVNAKLVKYPWDLVNLNGKEIYNDFQLLVDKNSENKMGKIYPSVSLINEKDIYVGKGSKIKPGVVLDAELGPIYIAEDVTIMPNAVIEGPCYIGNKSTIKIGAKSYENTSIGKVCKVGGEVEESIIHSYSNKQHDGFLGHAYLGQWVNIGADTNNSDLKNNYGNVKVILNDKEPIDSGLKFVGLIMGDHSKTSINTMINTGTVVGISSNIFGNGFPPKYIPSFSWGGSDTVSTYNLNKSMNVAKEVMNRRGKMFSEIDEELFAKVFELTLSERANRNM